MKKVYTEKEIIKKAQEIAEMITKTEEVDFYKRAEKQVSEHERVQQLISEIKGMQKEAVNLEHYDKDEAVKKADEKINSLQAELDQIPLVKEFKQSQLDVNGILQRVAQTISNVVTDEITKSNS